MTNPIEFDRTSNLHQSLLGKLGIMKYEDARNLAGGAPEIRRHCHVELRRIEIRKIIKAERCLVTVYSLDFLVPVPGPQRPKNKVGPIGRRKQGESINTSVFANPIPGLHMIRVGVFGT
jgi:hypothetical protein